MSARWRRVAVAVAAFWVCAALALFGVAAGAGAQWSQSVLSDNAYDDVDPTMDGGVVVWRAVTPGGADIHLYDLANPTPLPRPLTTDAADDAAPVVLGATVFWQRMDGGDWDIFHALYDPTLSGPVNNLTSASSADETDPALSVGTAAWVTDDGVDADIVFRDFGGSGGELDKPLGDDFNPVVDGGMVAWSSEFQEVYGWSAADPVIEHLSTTSNGNAPPDLDGDTVVWFGLEDGSGDPGIYLLDRGEVAPAPERINEISVSLTGARIDDGIVVWGNDSSGELDIVAYSRLTGLEREIGMGGVEEYSARVDGRFVAWEGFDGGQWDVYVHDLMTGETTRLTDRPTQDVDAGTADGHVFWTSYEGGDAETAVATFTGSDSPFPDVPEGHEFLEAIRFLARHDVISGYPDGLYGLYEPVLRAQMAKIVSLAYGVHDFFLPAFSSFSDVGPIPGDVYYPVDYIEEASVAGFIEGYTDGTFRPWNRLTRVQLVRILVRAAGTDLQDPDPAYVFPFTDVDVADREVVAKAHFNELINGRSATTFDPYGEATRGHVAKILYNSLTVAGDPF